MSTRARAEAMVEAVLRGDVPLQAPELDAALAAHPDLQKKIDELRALEQGLGDLAREPAAIYEEALAEVTPSDRAQVARVVRRDAAAPGRRPFLIAVAALLLVGIGAAIWAATDRTSLPTGPLSGTGSVRAERVGSTIIVYITGQLPPNERYRLRVVPSPAGAMLEDRTTESKWTLPEAWLAALESTASTLIVDVPGIGIVGSVRFERPR